MTEKIPEIKDIDIKRIILRDFSESHFKSVLDILSLYKSGSDKGMNRIYAAILKLSNGNIDLLKTNVAIANVDYRDVISLAEYPNSFEVMFDDLSDEANDKLTEEDWTQYQEWLMRL
jgi:uncharacterized protein YqfB (UPF0267 family)